MHDELIFQPKEGGEFWAARIGEANFSGYDIVLMIDKKNGTTDSGWMLELGIQADGSICGQITTSPGSDAMVLFESTRNKFSMRDNKDDCTVVIKSRD